MSEACGTCRFGFRRGEAYIYCHRYPPVPVYGEAEARWPMVRFNEVCGEWSAPRTDTKPVPADERKA